MQINNLKIKYSKTYNAYMVCFGNRQLEQFSNLEDAKNCARNIKDFTTKK